MAGASAGAPVNANILNMRAQQLAKQWRFLAFETANFHSEVVALGGPAGLAALPEAPSFDGTPGSWPAADGGGTDKSQADRYQYLADVLGTLPAIFNGDAAQPDRFSFSDALARLCGP